MIFKNAGAGEEIRIFSSLENKNWPLIKKTVSIENNIDNL